MRPSFSQPRRGPLLWLALPVMITLCALIIFSPARALNGTISGNAQAIDLTLLGGTIVSLDIDVPDPPVTLPADGTPTTDETPLDEDRTLDLLLQDVSVSALALTTTSHCEGDPGGVGETIVYAECFARIEDMTIGLTLDGLVDLDVPLVTAGVIESHTRTEANGTLTPTNSVVGSQVTNLCVIGNACVSGSTDDVDTTLNVNVSLLAGTVVIGGTVDIYSVTPFGTNGQTVTMVAINLGIVIDVPLLDLDIDLVSGLLTTASSDVHTLVDDTAPETTLTSGVGVPPAGNTTNDPSPTFTYTATDDVVDPVTDFTCTLDDESTVPDPDFTFDCDGGTATLDGTGGAPGPLADGTYDFCVAGSDGSNTDMTPACATFTVDAGAVDAADPDTTLLTTPPDPSNDATPTFTYAGSDDVTNPITDFTCTLDDESTVPDPDFTFDCDGGSVTLDGTLGTPGPLGEGTFEFCVASIDAALNTDPTPDCYSWTVDLTAPDTTILTGPADASTTGDSTPTFTFEGSDDLTLAANLDFECQVDSGSWVDCDSGSFTTAILGDGSHTFCVRAVDEAGNVDATPDCRTFTVDTFGPSATITSGPTDGGSTTDPTPTIEFESDDPNATFECSLVPDGDTRDWVPCTSPFTPGTDLPDGTYEFCVRATDEASNTGTPDCIVFTVDTTAPTTTITTGPADGSSTNDPSPTFEYTGDDGSGTGVAGFNCTLDDESTVTNPDNIWDCDGGTTTLDGAPPVDEPGPLADGTYTFCVFAVDTAGNTDATGDCRTFTIDTQDPTVSIDDGPGSGSGATVPNGDVQFDLSATDPSPSSGIDRIECRIFLIGDTPGSWNTCVSGASGSENFNGLADGDYRFQARAFDEAGNQSSNAVYDFTVDTGLPSTELLTGPGAPDTSPYTNDPTPTWTFRGTDTSAVAFFECSVDGDSYFACFDVTPDGSPAVGSYMSDPLGEGAHTFCVRAVDDEGMRDPSPACAGFEGEFFIDVTAPVLAFVAEQLRPDGQWVPYPADSGDPPWVNRLVRLRILCTDDDGVFSSGIAHRPTRLQYFVEDSKEIIVPANIYGNVSNIDNICQDQAGNYSNTGPATTLILRVDQQTPECTVKPVSTRLTDGSGWQTITFKVKKYDPPWANNTVSLDIKSITGDDGAKAKDWQVQTTTTIRFKAITKTFATRTYTVVWEVTDRAGNTSTCSAKVLVR